MMAQEYYKIAIIKISLFSLHFLVQCTLKYLVNYLCGVGVEVFFPNGCPKGSACLFDEIPDK